MNHVVIRVRIVVARYRLRQVFLTATGMGEEGTMEVVTVMAETVVVVDSLHPSRN